MANSYLNRTLGTPTNNLKWTFSAWIKKSGFDGNQALLSSGADANNRGLIYLADNGRLFVYETTSGTDTTEIGTNRVFRDVSAWYHIVVAVDTSQGTEANRVKIYVNGTQETSLSPSNYPSVNASNFINSAVRHDISGRNNHSSSDLYFNGYMSHVAFVDGQQLAPTVFGQTDSTSGIWKFKSPSGVTWGTNGFWLKFENSGALGTDSSGNSNTFTVNGNGRQALDTPSNVHATLNPLDAYVSHMVFSDGNNTVDNGSTASNKSYARSTLGMSSGKFYFEAKDVTNANYQSIGITDKASGGTDGELGGSSADYVYRNDAGQKGNNNSFSSYGNSYTTNDIIGCAVDLDNLKIYFSKNGVWQNSGDPTSGATGTGAAFTITAPSLTSTGFYFFAVGDSTAANSSKWSANFGNGLFGTTAISSAGSNGNGSLFEYDVPSGYYALNTKNINTYG
ncbi:hypothetical protein OAH93_00810 [Flavobacteriales bacterium]|nr:hypothetical protein [Flavobacteriales bacterium]